MNPGLQQSRPSGHEVLGVLGGMGPAATADFLGKLVRLHPARLDQDHIRSITCSFPDIPDRNAAILEAGPSPLPAMLGALSLLERSGADFIAIPCNTAHYWFEELQRHCDIPLLHIVDAVRMQIEAGNSRGRPAGLLATTATVRAGVYQKRLAQFSLHCVEPDAAEQGQVMDLIRRVKAGENTAEDVGVLASLVRSIRNRGAGAVVLACTELPLIAPPGEDIVDSTAALALECLRVWRDLR